jgi:UbiD family decarboxylase
MSRDLRQWLDVLRKEELLVSVNEQVDIDYTSAIAYRNEGKATLFEDVNGYSMPLLINAISTRRMLALALGCDESGINDTYVRKIANPMPPKLVQTGPCKEVILKGEEVDLSKFPIPFQHEYDGAPYISAPVQFARNPETGVLNMGMYRMMYRNTRETGFDMSGLHHLRQYLQKNMESGKPLPVACAVGLHPLDMVAACIANVKSSDVEILGGLRGESARMVKCETIDVEVPAWAEIVIEGELLPLGWVGDEGPYGEFTGCYGGLNRNPIFKVKAITHRKDPLFQSVTIGYNPGVIHTDQSMIDLAGWERNVWDALKSAGIEGVAVRFISNAFLFVSIKKKDPDDGRRAVKAIANAPFLGGAKYFVVLDDDVDIYDDWSALCAWNYRTQPDEDVMIFYDLPGFPLDPTIGSKRKTAIMGIDATRPAGIDQFKFTGPKPPLIAEVIGKQKPPQPTRSSTFEKGRVNILAEKIYQMLKERPMVFMEVLNAFRTENYRIILSAWGKLREQEKILRDGSDKPGHYGWKYKVKE